MAQLRVNNFSGGETDRYRDGHQNFGQTMKNLYVSENKRLISRPGFGGLYSDPRPWGNQAVQHIWNHCTPRDAIAPVGLLLEYDTFIMSNGAVKVRNITDVSWRTVVCADGNSGGIPFASKMKYVRLNDNEFVIIFDSASLGDFPTKFYREQSSGEWKYVSLGLPYYNDDGFAFPKVGGANFWLYAIVLKHTYTLYEPGSGFITKEVRSTPSISQLVTPGGVATATINPPAFGTTLNNDWLDNLDRVVGSDGCFAYSEIVWEWYRTISNGAVFYKMGEVSPNAANFDDSAADSTITDGAQLYINGGAVGNGMPNGRSFDGTYANGTLWLASTQRVWQNKVGIHDAGPGSFVFTVREGQIIKAVEAIDIYPIVLTSKGVYRIEGIVDDLGNGSHRVRTISETDGALSSRTTVKGGDRIYYLSSDGIYETNGYTTRKVSKHYNAKYQELISRTGLDANGNEAPAGYISFGAWDKQNRRIHWFFPKQGSEFCTDVLTLDLKYPHEEGFCITSGEIPYTALDVALEDGNIHIVTDLGYVLSQKDQTYDIDENNTQDRVAIEWEYISCSMSFGSSLVRKFFTRMLLHFTNLGDLTVKVQSDTDESDDYRDHNAIQERGFTRGLYFLKRWFPKGKLRGTYKTIRISNDSQVLFKSDEYGLGSKGVGSFFTLDGGANWPAGTVAGYFISIPADNYVTQYRVTSYFGGDTIMLSPSLPGGTTNSAWLMKGVPTTEKIEMNGYTVDYHQQGEGHTQSATVEQSND